MVRAEKLAGNRIQALFLGNSRVFRPFGKAENTL
jgi:hypothetical protein